MSQDAIVLQVEPRTVTGKAVRALRRTGRVPAVIHDHGKDSIIVEGDYIAMLKAYQAAGKHHTIEVKAGDKTYTTLIRTAEFEPKKHQLSHIVFNAVSRNQKVEAEVPIHAVYDEGNDISPAERNGLIVLSQMESVVVETTPSKIPDALTYNAEKLVAVGDHATIADLQVPADVEVKAEAGQSIATVFEPSAVAAANDSAGGDAEAGDEVSVDSEQGSAEDDQDSQAAEDKPGGQKQAEPKGE
jgi:ribosomal protein bL25 (Ctc-form)